LARVERVSDLACAGLGLLLPLTLTLLPPPLKTTPLSIFILVRTARYEKKGGGGTKETEETEETNKSTNTNKGKNQPTDN
jgi:hypothetical protein